MFAEYGREVKAQRKTGMLGKFINGNPFLPYMTRASVTQAANDIGMFLLVEGIKGKAVVLGDDSYCTLHSDGELMQNNLEPVPYEQRLEEAVDNIISDPDVKTIILQSHQVAKHLKSTGKIDVIDKNKGTYIRGERVYNLR